MPQKPQHSKTPAQLMDYWTKGGGAAKINWNSAGDFNRCVTALSKYVPAHMVKGLCANMHRKAAKGWPGHGSKE